jgi:hypothetical protein
VASPSRQFRIKKQTISIGSAGAKVQAAIHAYRGQSDHDVLAVDYLGKHV